MKVTLPRQPLQEALQSIVSVAGGRTTKPILACVRLTAKGDHLELAATDGEAALRLRIEAIVIDQPGETVVPADRLLGIVRELGDVEIKLDVDDRHCRIRGAGSDFKIYVMSAGDFPPIPTFEDEPDLVISGGELRRMIHLTLYAAARETSRYAMNGVLWERDGKRLYMVATDGRRLARAGGPVIGGASAGFQVIVPVKALSVVEKVFTAPKGDGDWTIDVKVLPNQVMLRSGDRLLATVLMEGNFPDYQRVLPKSSDKLARIDREELLAAVRRAALLTTEDSRAVRLKFDSENLVIESQSPEQGEARVELPIRFEGDAVEIGFNPVFLQDALKVMNGGDVCLEMQESFRPGVLHGGEKSDFLYVVMPVALAN